MRVNGFYIFLLLFLVAILLSSLYYPFRYFRYALPLFPLLLYVGTKPLRSHAETWKYFGGFLIFYITLIAYLFLANLLFTNVSDRFLSNAVFILSPLIFLMAIAPFYKSEKTSLYIKTIFVINVIIFFYEEGADLFTVLANPFSLIQGLITSQVETENHLAFVFGFFVIFFQLEKYSKRYRLLSWILFILCFKRVVILAVILSLLVYYASGFIKFSVVRHRKMITIILIVLNILFIKILQALTSGAFDDYIMEKTGFSANRFLMGRKTFYTEAFEQSGSANWFGLGLGKIDNIIYRSYGETMNFHSDTLKNYFEFGVVFFAVWLILFYYKTLFSNKAMAYLIVLNILMLSDNVFIYFDIMFYFYFFILILLVEKSEKAKAQQAIMQSS